MPAMTAPDADTFAATLRQTAPIDSGWPQQHIEMRRTHLLDLLDDAERRLAEATRQHDEAADTAAEEVAALQAKVPDVGDNPTDVEWLTRRAAQAERDLAASRHEAASSERWVKRQRINLEVHQLAARIAQIDDLMETGAYAAGNAAQMEVVMLDVQEAAADLVHDTGVLEIARQREAAAKRMHREINAALPKAKRAEERSRKQS